MEAATRERGRGRTLVRHGLHLAGLSALAIAQPLFDLLESDPSELVAAEATGGAVVVIALVLLLVPPLVLLAVEAAVGLVSAPAVQVLHLVFVGALVTVYVTQSRTSIGVLPTGTAPLLAIAVVIGAAVAYAYRRSAGVRTFASLLGVAPVVAGVAFLFVGPVSPLVSRVADLPRAPQAETDTPVVLIVFDELPVSSLLDAEGQIDRVRFPAFGRLAADATWVRNTTTVDALTPWAVPAILDGRRPRPRVYSHWRFHPQNVFTLLGRPGEVNAVEPLTRLCPPALCAEGTEGALRRGTRALRHLADPMWRRLLPGRAADPGIELSERALDLLGVETPPTFRARRERDVDLFVERLGDGLNVLHSTFPHGRWEFQRTARYRLELPEPFPGASPRDADLTDLDRRMHLLQTEHADAVLARVIERLEDQGRYDETVLAVVADHGVAFEPGRSRRVLSPSSIREIAPVPFFIKAPGQRRARVVDGPAETVDVMPTIADVLDIDIPWEEEGRSVFGPPRDLPMASLTRQGGHAVTTPRRGLAPDPDALADQLELAGHGRDRSGLFALRGYAPVIGRRVPAGLPQTRARVVRESPLRAVGGIRPLGIQARIEPAGPGGRVIAVAACGRIAAVGRTVRMGDDERLFAVRSEHIADTCPQTFVALEGTQLAALIPGS